MKSELKKARRQRKQMESLKMKLPLKIKDQRQSRTEEMKIKIENLGVVHDPADVTDPDLEGHATDHEIDRVTGHADPRGRDHAETGRGTEGDVPDLETGADLDQEIENDRDISRHILILIS